MPTHKTLFDLQDAIAGYLNRQPSTFVTGGKDNLLRSINNAKDYVQRAIDFELAKVSILVRHVDLLHGGSLKHAVLFEHPEYGAPWPPPWDTDGVGGLPRPEFPNEQTPDGCFPSQWQPWICQCGCHRHVSECNRGWQLLETSWRTYSPVFRDKPVDVKRVLRGYLPFINNSGVAPIGIISKQEWASRRKRLSDEFTSLRLNEAKAMLAATGFAIVLDGTRFFIDPQSPQVFGGQAVMNVYFDAIRWLEDFDPLKGCQEHLQFLLDYCFDILLYRSLAELNIFLKEDERVVITKTAWDEAWRNVVLWNATTEGNTVDVSLD